MWWVLRALLTENMDVDLQLFEGNAISTRFPARHV